MKTLTVIPARYASTRFEKKLLRDETGWPLIRHVYEQVKQASLVDDIYIATDDQRIVDVVETFGGKAIMTSDQHPSGTDRIAEAVEKIIAEKGNIYDVVVNVQGDEPEIEPDIIDQIITLHRQSNAFVSTLVCPFPADKTSGSGSPSDPSCVKAILGGDIDGLETARFALYFTRALAPYPRGTAGEINNPTDYFMHIGMYAYSPDSLNTYVAMPQSFLETTEKLEQLRILENGHSVAVDIIPHATPGIDTREDYDAFIERWNAKK